VIRSPAWRSCRLRRSTCSTRTCATSRTTRAVPSCRPPGRWCTGFRPTSGRGRARRRDRVRAGQQCGVDNYQDVALQAVGPRVAPSSVTFTDNVIIARSLPVPAEQVSIFIVGGVTARVTGNMVTGGVCDIPGCSADPISELQAFGMFASPIGAGTTISGNHISGSDVGVYVFGSPNCCKIADNDRDHCSRSCSLRATLSRPCRQTVDLRPAASVIDRVV
jgi:hypothetical protein